MFTLKFSAWVLFEEEFYSEWIKLIIETFSKQISKQVKKALYKFVIKNW